MKKFLKLLLLIASLILLYSFLIEPNFVATTYIDLNFSSLPKSFKGFRIVQLTDLHFGSTSFLIYPIVLEKVKELKPNIIVITGDLVSSKSAVNQAASFVNYLSKIAPTYIVFGNWDHWENLENYSFLFSNTTLLINSNTFLHRNNESICLVGVDDPYTGFDDLQKALPKNCSFKILLAHSPQIIGKARGKVNLILAGHTHGGQVRFPFIGALFVPLPEEYKKYTYGLFFENSTYMFVSRGIGTRLLPIRFLCSPEIVVVQLNK